MAEPFSVFDSAALVDDHKPLRQGSLCGPFTASMNEASIIQQQPIRLDTINEPKSVPVSAALVDDHKPLHQGS